MRYIAHSTEELTEAASDIVSRSKDFPVICLYGEMGAGKTTLVKEICSQLGVKDSMSSPTFSIVNEYRDQRDQPVYHFDFYRIENEREALDTGVEEYFYSGHICLIEWPEVIAGLLPAEHLEISIKLVGDNAREITLI